MIKILENERTFHLQTEHTSMIFHVLKTNHLVCLYWGQRVEGQEFSYIVDDIKRASYLSDTDCIKNFKLEQMPLTYPAYGNPDMRDPTFMFEYQDGSRITDLRYKEYHHYLGKKKLNGLPTVLHQDSEVIEFVLFDTIKNVEVVLTLTVFENYDAFTQSIQVTNKDKAELKINKLMSSCWSFLDDCFQCLTLVGAWGRENHIQRTPLHQGTFALDSKRGASGHGQNPFLALMSLDCQEDYGDVYAMNFVYSGNFEARVEVDMHQNTRMMMGINSFDFQWSLNEKESFVAPEVVLVHSHHGLQEMTNRFHKLYRECLIKEHFMKEARPILINNWEATYYDFNRKKLLSLAEEASQLGMELFVLDDGWFGHRNSDNESLGDWNVNEEKLGGSLHSFVETINDKGMKFGLWVEPEMVSPNSQLYSMHPDWIISVPERIPQQARHQYILDLSRQDVQDYIVDSISSLLRSAHIEYIKWDMNRNMTDLGTSELSSFHQKELSHRYILGLYAILENLIQRFPHVLFEGCAGGGGRFDPGMLYYMPQIWASDDTEAIERLEIQRGTSLIYPSISMGCHVSASPNHQVGRITDLNTRGIVAMEGNLGYELDLTKMSKCEKENIQKQVSLYKEIRAIIQFGEFYFLKCNENAWMHISKTKKKVVVNYVQTLAKANTVPKRLRLKALETESYYQIQGTTTIRSGYELMNIGLDLNKADKDFYAQQWILVQVKI